MAKSVVIENYAMFMLVLKSVAKSSSYFIPITIDYVFVKQGKEEIKLRKSRLWQQ
jgi:hypothetical protein